MGMVLNPSAGSQILHDGCGLFQPGFDVTTGGFRVKKIIAIMMVCLVCVGCAGAAAQMRSIPPPTVETLTIDIDGVSHVAMTANTWSDVQAYISESQDAQASTAATVAEIVGAVVPVVQSSANLALVIGRIVTSGTTVSECTSASVGEKAARPER